MLLLSFTLADRLSYALRVLYAYIYTSARPPTVTGKLEVESEEIQGEVNMLQGTAKRSWRM